MWCVAKYELLKLYFIFERYIAMAGVHIEYFLKVALTFFIFFCGHRIGFLNGVDNYLLRCSHFDRVDYTSIESSTQPIVCADPICGAVMPIDESVYLHSTDKERVLDTVFGMLHHASNPSDADLILSKTSSWGQNFSSCATVYGFRSPTRSDHPNKCVGVIRSPENGALGSYYSPTSISHRYGFNEWPQNFTDRYQDDIVHFYSLDKHREVTLQYLNNRFRILNSFRVVMGHPVDVSTGKRRSLVVLVANEGVMDLLLNLLCSVKAANIDTSSFVVFLGDNRYAPLIESFGAKTFQDDALGLFPKENAGFYGDRIFTRVMWIKVTTVYTAIAAGFNVLFQDVDLVWLKNPLSYLEALDKYDIVYMDDGARTPRFAPYFINSGFYFVRNNDRVIYLMERLIRSFGEIDYTASHQATMIRYITEIQAAFGMQFMALDSTMFPSGRMYHEHPQYVRSVKAHKFVPFVWHMCWTKDRDDKVMYYKKLGFWFIPTRGAYKEVCEEGSKLLHWYDEKIHLRTRGEGWGKSLEETCCTPGGYYTNKLGPPSG